MEPLVRPFQPTDRERLLAIKCEVFGSPTLENERRRWEWEFEQNPARDLGIPHALVLAEGDELLGFFGIVPYRVKLGDSVGSAGDGIDLCILPKAQGQGLAHPLVAPLWQPGLCDFAFAVAVNPASNHLFAAHGAELFGGEREHAGFVYRPDVAAASKSTRGGVEVQAYDEWEDHLWQGLAEERPLSLVKDARYLNWRYAKFPFASAHGVRWQCGSEPSGLLVWQLDPATKEMFLLELLTRRDDTATQRELLAVAIDIAHTRGAQVIYAGTREESLRRALRDSGFSDIPGDLPSFMGKVHGSGSVAAKAWTPSLGDGDVLFNLGEPRQT